MTKLSPGTLILAVFAVLFGLVGAYAAKQYLREEPQPEVVEVDTRRTVPLAAADLSAGRTITMGDVMLVRMSPEQISERGITAGFMTNPRQVIGRTLRRAVPKGEAFVVSDLYPEGMGPSMADRLKPGYRAVSISLEPRAAQSRLVSPGSMVDVLFRTFRNKAEHVPETTVTLLQRVEVLAIGQETFLGARAPQGATLRSQMPPTVTLAVTPQQAGALAVVDTHGTMSLILCGPEGEIFADGSPADRSKPQTLTGLLGFPQPEKPFTTELYRRGKMTTSVFEKERRTDRSETAGPLPGNQLPGNQLPGSQLPGSPLPAEPPVPTAMTPRPEPSLALATHSVVSDGCSCGLK
ncbi:MAG: Flp pilus assembly protein CpaB [Thermoguttaceae bacterium]